MSEKINEKKSEIPCFATICSQTDNINDIKDDVKTIKSSLIGKENIERIKNDLSDTKSDIFEVKEALLGDLKAEGFITLTKTQLATINKEINGNGEPGLIKDVKYLRAEVDRLKKEKADELLAEKVEESTKRRLWAIAKPIVSHGLAAFISIIGLLGLLLNVPIFRDFLVSWLQSYGK